MSTLSDEYPTLMAMFAPVFSRRIWQHVQVLVIGGILAPGKRTVTSALRVMGLSQEEHFQNNHRVLNRAIWSSLEVSRVLLGVLVSTFAVTGPVVMGLDDTLERRRGSKIKAKGIYRDAIRSSQSHFVKASGLRWLSLMLAQPVSRIISQNLLIGAHLWLCDITRRKPWTLALPGRDGRCRSVRSDVRPGEKLRP